MNNPELVKVGRTGHDLRELKSINDRKVILAGKQRMGLPIANGLPLDWTSCIPSYSHFASSQRRYGNIEDSWRQTLPKGARCLGETGASNP